jgi:hypothetical protein
MLFKDSQRTTDKGQIEKTFWLGSASPIWLSSLPTMICPRHIKGPTYLPRIHIYRDTYLSSL